MKKGQITLYVIIAVALVSAIAVVVFMQTNLFKPQVSDDVRPINTFIESCLKSTGEDALIYIGKQGGYYKLPTNSIDDYVYYLYNNKSYLPTKDIIEHQISLYVNEMLPFCTRNFADFSQFIVDEDPYAISTKTEILSNKVLFTTRWNVPVKKGDKTYQLNEFSAEIDSRLNSIYNLTENFMQEQMKDTSSICLSCMVQLGIENDLYIDMEDYDNESVIFTITDKNMEINQEYKWIFANKYK